MTADAATAVEGADDARVAELFDAVVELLPDAARRLLEKECAAHPKLRAEVERLLAHDRTAPEGFLAPLRVGLSVPSPTRVGRYVVLRKLGEGGMGDVYAAYDESLDRRVAVKMLHSSHVPEAWLHREARALARLAHPNVVTVHEIGEHAGAPFVAMELVEGRTLREWLAEPRSPHDILRMFLQCGRGLAAAHAAGLVHRDFKPINVIVGEDERARVLDFGIVALRDDAVIEENGLVGTPPFMSPEQLLGERITPASDQFSFSVALYRALYGAAPFAGDDLATLRRNVLAGALRRPPRVEGVPEWVQRILFRGLARHVAARHDSLDAMLDAIEAELPRDPQLDPSASRRARRIFAVAMLGIGVIISTVMALRADVRSAPTVRDLVSVAAVVFIASVTVVFVLRRRLFANRFGARFAGFIVIATTTLLLHRLFALHFEQPPTQVMAIDMLALGCELALAAALVERSFLGGAACFLVGSVVALIAPAASLAAMACSAMATFAIGVAAWRKD